jgi:hypothetical protein
MAVKFARLRDRSGGGDASEFFFAEKRWHRKRVAATMPASLSGRLKKTNSEKME